MKRKPETFGGRFVRGATRLLFPMDTPRSHGQINHDRWGDRRERVYKSTGEVRDIKGAELRRNRQRDEDWKWNS
jgi:hypothetical protein